MKPTQALHDLGQSLWLDNITRDILDKGTLRRYAEELSVTGLTSNPTIFDEAIGGGSAYDEEIRRAASRPCRGPLHAGADQDPGQIPRSRNQGRVRRR